MHTLFSNPTHGGDPISMRLVYFCLLLLISFFRASTSLSIPSTLSISNVVNSSSRLTNLSLGSRVDPPKSYQVTFEIGGAPLDKTALFLNTVEALKILALDDPDAQVADNTEYVSTQYPKVSFVVNTATKKRTVKVKHVLWAIFSGVHEIILQKKFEFAQFEMTWNGNLLGWVHAVNNPAAPGLVLEGNSSNNTLEVARRSLAAPPTNVTGFGDANVTNLVNADLSNDPDEARLIVDLEPIGTKLGIYDVLFPVMQALSEMAFYPTSQQTQGIIAGYEGTIGIVCIIGVEPRRSQTPFLQYGWMIRAISRIPVYAITHRLGELEIVIAVDEVVLGYGRLSNLTTCVP